MKFVISQLELLKHVKLLIIESYRIVVQIDIYRDYNINSKHYSARISVMKITIVFYRDCNVIQISFLCVFIGNRSSFNIFLADKDYEVDAFRRFQWASMTRQKLCFIFSKRLNHQHFYDRMINSLKHFYGSLVYPKYPPVFSKLTNKKLLITIF